MMRALVLSLLLLAGCASAPTLLGQQSPQGDWVIARIAGQPAQGEGNVHFDPPGGSVNGNAPCNMFGGMTYTLAGARILIDGRGQMTLRACADPARQERERIFTDVLFKSPHFVIHGDLMQLTGPSGEVIELRRAAE